MSNILDLLNSNLGKTLIEGTSNQFNENKNKTEEALKLALPIILGAMKNNTRSQQGATGLLNALESNKHNGSVLNNLNSILGGQQIDNDVIKDGSGILNHVFAGREQNVANAVSKKSGINLNTAMQILKVAAPFVMSYLGKKKREKNITNQSEMDQLLGGLLGNEAHKDQNIVEKILDADNDGSVIDDIFGMATKRKSNNSSIGGLLGGLFNK